MGWHSCTSAHGHEAVECAAERANNSEAVRSAGGTQDKDTLRLALEGLRLSLPEDPDGFQSFMDPQSHQLMQTQAIGKTVFNPAYPPATVQLGDWTIYEPPAQWPRLPGDVLPSSQGD